MSSVRVLNKQLSQKMVLGPPAEARPQASASRSALECACKPNTLTKRARARSRARTHTRNEALVLFFSLRAYLLAPRRLSAFAVLFPLRLCVK